MSEVVWCRVSQPGSDTAVDIPRHIQSLSQSLGPLVDFGSFKVPIGKDTLLQIQCRILQIYPKLFKSLFRNILVKRLLLVRGGLASSKKASFSDLEPVTGK